LCTRNPRTLRYLKYSFFTCSVCFVSNIACYSSCNYKALNWLRDCCLQDYDDCTMILESKWSSVVFNYGISCL
jgi:hypothetical protein